MCSKQDIIEIFHELIDDSSDSMVSSARLSQPCGWFLLLLRREVISANEFRVNEFIRVSEVRLIGAAGEKWGSAHT